MIETPQVIGTQEAIVLCCMMRDPDACAYVLPHLEPGGFQYDFHNWVYDSMRRINDRKQPVEYSTIYADMMRYHEEMMDEQCRTSLFSIMEQEPATTLNIKHYLAPVLQRAERAKVKRFAQEAISLMDYNRLLNGEDVGNGLEFLARSNGRYHLSQLIGDDLETETFPRMRKAGDFLTEVGEPPPFLVDNLLPDKRLILVTGKPKFGKSFVVCDIACRVAAGHRVFNEYAVNRPGPVIWLQMEDGEFENAERLRKRGLQPGCDLPLYLITERMNLNRAGSMAYLQKLMDAVRPVLLIVDTARAGLGISRWEDPADVESKMRPLCEFAHNNCTVLLVHHNRKMPGEDGDEISGTNALTAACDGWLSAVKAEKLANGNRRMQFKLCGRSNMDRELVVEMDTATLHISLVQQETIDAERARDNKDSNEERIQPVVDACARMGTATVEQLAAECCKSVRTVQYYVREAVALGRLEEVEERGGSRNKAAMYRVPSARDSDSEDEDGWE
jgi:hypothetical protein